MKKKFDQFRLRNKLIMIMLATILFSLLAFFWLGNQLENRLLKALEIHTNNLALALQASVEELTTQGATDEEQLMRLLATLSRSGLKEVSIISPEREVIASSDPAKSGLTVEIPSQSGFVADGSEELSGQSRYSRHLFLPVVMEDESAGYVHLVLNLANFSRIIKEALYNRILIGLLIFSLGAGAVVVVASRFVRPVNELVRATRSAAQGQLCKVKSSLRKDELGELSHAFNDMIEQISKNHQLERKLSEARHFSQIGQLASGIAHELRNPLNFINLSVDHLQEQFAGQVKDQEDFKFWLKRMKDEVTNLNGLTNNFLKLGKPVTLNLKPEDLNSLITLWAKQAQEKARPFGVEVVVNLTSGLPRVAVDRDELECCFQNIFVNSLEAFIHPGEFRVTTRPAGDHWGVAIILEDNGEGIELDHQARVFEPYFSTKKAGIGLGLAITKRIVEQHGGTITLESQPKAGTRVTILLPAA